MLPTVWIMVLLHFRVGLSLRIILKRALQELEGPQRLLPLCEGTSWNGTDKPASIYLPQGQFLRFPHGGLKYPVHLDTPAMNECTGRVHQNLSARKLYLYIKYCLLCKSHAHKKLVVVKLSDVDNVSIPDRICGTSSLVTDDFAMAWPLRLIINMCRPAISCSKHLVCTEPQ